VTGDPMTSVEVAKTRNVHPGRHRRKERPTEHALPKQNAYPQDASSRLANFSADI